MSHDVVVKRSLVDGQQRFRTEYVDFSGGKARTIKADFWVPKFNPGIEGASSTGYADRHAQISIPILINKRGTKGANGISLYTLLHFDASDFNLRRDGCLNEASLAGAYGGAIAYAYQVATSLDKTIRDLTGYAPLLQEIRTGQRLSKRKRA